VKALGAWARPHLPRADRVLAKADPDRLRGLPGPTHPLWPTSGARYGRLGPRWASSPRGTRLPHLYSNLALGLTPARRVSILPTAAAGGVRPTPLAVGPAPAPGVRDRGPGLSPLRRPAADPRRGDGARRGAPAPRGARARRRAAAGAARPRRLTCARSRPPPAATVPPGGRPPVCPPGLSVGFRASSPDLPPPLADQPAPRYRSGAPPAPRARERGTGRGAGTQKRALDFLRSRRNRWTRSGCARPPAVRGTRGRILPRRHSHRAMYAMTSGAAEPASYDCC
jgi:hypothetical protein